MRPQGDGVHLLGALVREPRLDHVGREHAALEQKGVVRLQRRERLVQRARRVLHVLALRRLELVKSTSIGLGGSILFLTPSRPAMSSAANVRYPLLDGSGARNSIRLALGDLEYTGMRQIADRLRCE